MGDMKVMPKGATALDFAFNIHTDVGYHCTSIKVNGKLEPMGYVLQNGDKVDVVTRRNQKPSEAWLKYVITGKARSKIRSSMKEEKKKKGELAKEALVRKFKNMKVDFEESIEVMIKHFGLQSRPDLYYEIFLENIKLQELSKTFDVINGKLVKKIDEEELAERKAKEMELREAAAAEQINKNVEKRGKTNLVIDGQPADTFQYSFATCCNPLPGDQIFAYPVTNQGLKIHRLNCPNATQILANFGFTNELIHSGFWYNVFFAFFFISFSSLIFLHTTKANKSLPKAFIIGLMTS
jgi:GTP pyrophosphokinase